MYHIEFPEEYETLFRSQCVTLRETLCEYFFNLDNGSGSGLKSGSHDADNSFEHLYPNIYNSFDTITKSKINGMIKYRNDEKNKVNAEFMDCIKKMKMLNIELPSNLNLEYVVTYYNEEHAKGYVITPCLKKEHANYYFNVDSGNNECTMTNDQNICNIIHGCCRDLGLNLNDWHNVTP